jgi:hypothetical protein
MSLSKVLVVLAGAAAGLASSAAAQTSDAQAYKAELLADAANRTSLLAAGGAGRDDQGFFITDGGANKLYIKGSAIFRYTASFRSKRLTPDADPPQPSPDPDPNAVTDQDNFTHGFANRLTRIGVAGSLWDPNFNFALRGKFENGGSDQLTIPGVVPEDPPILDQRVGSDGSFGLDDAFFQYTWDSGFYVKGGQFKLDLFREGNVSEEYQLATERSVVGTYFDQGRSQGLQLGFDGQRFRGSFAFTDGFRSQNTDWNDAREADYALTARVEFKGAGEWIQFSDFTNFRDANQAWLIGAAIHWQDTGETGDGNDLVDSSDLGVQTLFYTLDFSYEGAGWNFFGAFIGASIDPELDGAQDTDDFGGVLQAGFFLNDQIEIFGRWDGLFLDSDTTTDPEADDDFHFGTAGVNYYLSPKSHAAKLQADITWAFSKTSDLRSASLSNPLGTNVAQLGQRKSGEIGVRLQAVVVF